MCIKVRELRKSEKRLEYQEKIRLRWERVRGMERQGVEEEWGNMKRGVLVDGAEVCGYRRVGVGKRKGSEWWNDRVKRVVEEKKRLFEEWLQGRDRGVWERYREKRKECSREVKWAKRQASRRAGSRLTEVFARDRNAFWRDIQKTRSGNKERIQAVKDRNGQLVMEEVKVRERFKEHFEELLSLEEEREAIVLAIGRRGVMPVLGELNNRPIERREIGEAVKEMKLEKAAGLDGVAPELLKFGGEDLILWLERLLGTCFEESVTPRDFRDMCIVPCYKGKGDKQDCNSYRGICLMSVVGKLYGRVLINRVVKGTEAAIGEEQCGFRKGRGCIDQDFCSKTVV